MPKTKDQRPKTKDQTSCTPSFKTFVTVRAGLVAAKAWLVRKCCWVIGASPFKDVLKLVLRRGILLALAGIAIGVVAALGLTRYLATLLFEVRPIDLPTFLIVGAALILVALIACVIPARRAARVDPLVALRYE